jgi:hypothetical protein
MPKPSKLAPVAISVFILIVIVVIIVTPPMTALNLNLGPPVQPNYPEAILTPPLLLEEERPAG